MKLNVNPLYLLIHKIVKKKKKINNIGFTDSNSEVLKTMQKFGVELKIKLKR